jgi:O-antigen/teichoic acid export membrane protein
VGGLGAWSIILMQLATTATSTVMLWCFSGWHPRIAFSLQSLRDLGGFGANVFGTRLLFYLNHNVDNMLVGRVLGAAPLGVYSLAYNGVLAPLNRVAIPVQHVLYPAFARLRHDPPRMRSAWLRSTRLLVAVVAPLCLGLVVVAPDFVTVFFGERWTDATPVIQILAWVALLQAVSTFASGVLQALDRAQALLRFAIVSFAVYLVAFVVGLLWGIVGVAACYAVAATFAVQPLYLRLVTRALGLSVHDLCRSLSGVAQVCAALLVVEVVLRQALVQSGVPPALRLAVVVGLAIVLFLPLCSWRAHEVVEEMRILRPRLRSGRSQTSFRAGEAL